MTLITSIVLGNYLVIDSSSEPTISADRIDAYLLEKNSPLAGQGAVFVAEGHRFDIDPRLVIAIAGAETTFGTDMGCNASFNAWSWFWNDATDCPNNPLESWEEGIYFVTRQMSLYRSRFLEEGMAFSIQNIGLIYCVEGCEHWVPNITQFYRDDLGGDTSNLGFSDTEPSEEVIIAQTAYNGQTDVARTGLDHQRFMIQGFTVNSETHITGITLRLKNTGLTGNLGIIVGASFDPQNPYPPASNIIDVDNVVVPSMVSTDPGGNEVFFSFPTTIFAGGAYYFQLKADFVGTVDAFFNTAGGYPEGAGIHRVCDGGQSCSTQNVGDWYFKIHGLD
jgi:hypothetical protein